MTERALDPRGSEEDRRLILADLLQAEKDRKFLDRKIPELKIEHPDRWVAAYEERIVAIGDTLEEVIQKAEKSGLSRSRLSVRFMRSKPIRMIL